MSRKYRKAFLYALPVAVTVFFGYWTLIAPKYTITFSYNRVELANVNSQEKLPFTVELKLVPGSAQNALATQTGFDSLYVYTVTVYNHGRWALRQEDFESPLRIELLDDTRLIFARANHTDPEMTPGLKFDSKTADLGPTTLQKGESINIDLFIASANGTRSKEPPFLIRGRILDVSDYSVSRGEPSTATERVTTVIVAVSLALVFVVVFAILSAEVPWRLGALIMKRTVTTDTKTDITRVTKADVLKFSHKAMSSSSARGRLLRILRHENVAEPVLILTIQRLTYLVVAHYIRGESRWIVVNEIYALYKRTKSQHVKATILISAQILWNDGVRIERDELPVRSKTRLEWIRDFFWVEGE